MTLVISYLGLSSLPLEEVQAVVVRVLQFRAALGCQLVDQGHQLDPVDFAAAFNAAPSSLRLEEGAAPRLRVEVGSSLDPLPMEGLELDHSFG